MPVTQGTMLGGKYRLQRELGEGGMGAVWLAENTVLQSEVAIKVLHASISNPAAHARFSQEAKGVAQLESPHIVHVFDYGATDDGEPFLVMERLTGTTLFDRIEESEMLDVAEVVTIIQQICRALTHAHERGIVHRDLKPANIFVQDVDGEPFVKLLDFGIAKHSGSGNMGLTDTGAMMGTPYYMSPEQFVDPSKVDFRTDLWSVGVVAYAALLGTLPFDGATVGALSLAVHEGAYDKPGELREGLPVGFDRFFDRVFQTKPEDRHASARDLAKAFAKAAKSQRAVKTIIEPVLSGGDLDELGETAAAPAPRSVKKVSLTAAGVTEDPAALAPRIDEEPSSSDDPSRWWLAGAVAAVVVVGGYAATRGDEPARATTRGNANPAASVVESAPSSKIAGPALSSASARAVSAPVAASGHAATATETAPSASSEKARPPSSKPTSRPRTVTAAPAPPKPSATATPTSNRPKAREDW